MSFWTRWRRLVHLGPTLSKRIPNPKSAKRRRTRRLILEALEDRTLLSATLSLDQQAYAPGQTAVITGTGFNPGDTLSLQITRTDANSTGATYTPLTVTDDANGNFTTTWVLPTNETTDPATAAYQITASGPSTADSATATFARLAPSVQTDKLDYSPGQTATITGSGFQAGETVDMQVVNTSTGLPSGNPPTWTATADAQGNIQTSWTCTSDLAGASLELDATGESSGLAASEAFTDSSNANSGDGTMTVTTTPTTVYAGSTGDNLTFTFSAPNGNHPFNSGSQATVAIPTGWTAPQTTSPTAPGYVTVTAYGGGSVSSYSASGQTITINFTTSGDNQGFNLNYDNATAPAANTYQFTTQTKQAGGTLTNIKTQPTVTVNASNTTTSVSSTHFTSTYGQSVTFIAMVQNTGTSGGFPTGSVEFFDGANDLGPGTPLTSVSGLISESTLTITTLTAGNHNIQAVYTPTGNFGSSSGTLTQTVNKLAVNLTGSRVYDGTTTADSSILSVANKVGSDNVTVASGSATLASKDKGSETITSFGTLTLGGTAANNYTLTGATGSVSISALAVNLTGSRTYDGTTSASSSNLTVSNAITGDTVDVASGSGTLAGKDKGSESISSFGTLTLGNNAAGDYTLTGATGSVTINPLVVNLTGSRAYDRTTAASSSILTVSNKINGDTVTVASGSGTLAGKDAGAESITSFGTLVLGNNTAGDYTLTGATGSVTVTPLVVNLAGSRTYDGTTAANYLILTVSNAISGDTVDVASGSGTLASKDVGTRAITSFGNLSLGNNTAGDYTLTGATGSVTVNLAALTVTANSQSMTYGGSLPANSVGYSGFVNSEDASVLGGSLSYSYLDAGNNPVTPVHAGSYAIVASGLTSSNYTISYVNGTLTINKATPSGTVGPDSITYGTTLDGSQLGTSLGGVAGTFAFTGADNGKVLNAGTYQEAYKFTPNDTSDYNTVSGTVEVDVAKANAVITVTPYTSATTTYDGTAHTATGTAKGVGGVDLSSELDLSHTTHINAGTYSSDYWSFSGDTNYNAVAATTITDSIAKANAVITVTPYTSATTTYDGNAHTATGSAKGVQGETLTGLDLSGTTHTNAGSYADMWTFTDVTGNYNNIAATTITDSIAKAGTSVTVSSSLNPSAVGQSVTFTATVTNTSTSPVPTGTVQFVIDGSNYGSAMSLVNGNKVSISAPALTVGTHSIYAVYSNSDGNFQGSKNNPLLQTVNYVVGNNGQFYPPITTNSNVKGGSTLPIKFQVTDANGNVITNTSAVTSITVQGPSGMQNLYSNGVSSYAAGGTVFRYDPTAQQFIFNWNTKNPVFTLGKYTITATLADGGHTQITATINLATNGSNAGLVIDGASTAGTDAGGLLAGDMTVYVDDSNGGFTSDEMARIEDAINGIETLIAPYGSNLVEVDSSVGTAATFIIDANSTSAVGGYADGVLGCYNDAAGQITLIAGWNWYAGSDPTQVGAGQYDFQTVVTHELGHALGLGHSSNTGSVMYASLDTGVAHRTLTAQDLNIADPDGGADGLHAAVPTANVSMTGSSAANSQAMTVSNNTNPPLGGQTPSTGNSSPLSTAYQLFADFARILGDARNVFQSQSPSLSAQWQQADALAMQRLDTLLSLEAGAMGVSKDILMRDLFFSSLSSSTGT